MNTPEEIKLTVKEKYAEIAEQSKAENAASCCGAGSPCGDMDYTIMSDEYVGIDGYVADADLSLGCGLPTAFAELKPGMTVLDLGSGAGNDVFIAAKAVGPTGKAIGIDMTEVMIEKANINKEKVGADNVEFRLGDIEDLPVEKATVDTVISNCVLNLVPDKQKAFNEIDRVLKPGGNFTVSDIVLVGQLDPKLRTVAELYAGCVAGALQKDEYLAHIEAAGFTNIDVVKEKEIIVPSEMIEAVTEGVAKNQKDFGDTTILSITVRAVKPASKAD